MDSAMKKFELKQEIEELKEEIKVLKRLPEGHPARNRLLELERQKTVLHEHLAELEKQKTIMMQQRAAAGAQAGGSLPGAASAPDGWAAAEFRESLRGLQAVYVQVSESLGEIKAAIALALFAHCRPVSSTNSRLDNEYRNNAIRYYYGDAAVGSDTLTCMVSGQEFPSSQIIAAHVFRKEWPLAILANMGKAINDTTNILLIRTQIEKMLNSFEVAIIPEPQDNFRFVVLNRSLLRSSGQERFVGTGSATDNDTMTWGQIDRKLLHVEGFCEGARPARRILAFHAHLAILHAEASAWITKGDVEVTPEGWESPGYDSGLMRTFLEQQAAALGGSDAEHD